ncbi:MAG: hypothetical protein A2Y81_09240 [Nitrospirae bacterium RBG_13_43_8]|nr:MAG: hypothetical protein A2Y81_09240 [Nitrospirae bacterium RBG_13_43_8]
MQKKVIILFTPGTCQVVEISCKALFAMLFLAIMEQRFELTKDEIKRVKQKLAVAPKREKARHLSAKEHHRRS